MTGRGNIEAIYPLTPVQDGILFHTLYAPDSPLYIQQFTAQLNGGLDIEALRSAWDHVAQRHEALRSLLTWEDRSRPLQIVRAEASGRWVVEDWRDRTAEQQASHLDDWLEADRKQGFDLETAPLMRFAVFRMADDVHRFVWTHHHVVVDGWSIGIVLGEVAAVYAARTGGGVTDLAPPAAYRSYVQWLQRKRFDEAETYWRAQLHGIDGATRFRIERPEAPQRWAEHHAEHTVRLPDAATAALTNAARSAGVTTSTLLRAAWGILLNRYSGDDDVVFGATVAGRPAEVDGALDMVGMFINTLPVRVTVDDAMPVRSWLADLQGQQIDMAAYESTPLVSVQGWSDVAKGEPLFSTVLVFENVPDSGAVGDGLPMTDIHYLQRSNYPLALLVMPGSRIELIMLYDADRFAADAIARIGDHLQVILAALPDYLDHPIGEVPMLTAEELETVTVAWNDTGVPIRSDVMVHDLIREAAEQHPDRVAVAGGEVELTYRKLHTSAEAIAAHLAEIGAGPGSRVAVAIHRSPAFIAAMLGVLHSGAAYVPLDPTLPPARLRRLLDDTAAVALVVGQASVLDAAGCPVVEIGSSGELTTAAAPEGPQVFGARPSPDDAAYVLYTSGSTGSPKGVEVLHRNLVNSTEARRHTYNGEVGAYLLLSPVVFDSSVAGIYWTLTQGGTLVMPEPQMEQDVHHLGALIERWQVTHTLALPSVYGLLLDHISPRALGSLRVVIVAGEACPPALVARHYRALPGTDLYNEYGPTECTVWASVHRIDPDDETRRRTPIGRPIANTQVYVLDAELRPVPVGVPGELCLAGANLVPGYLGRPDLTGEQFVETSLPPVGDVRFYRTGDIARWTSDGALDLLGRVDHQVKIRGQRIELGEIESMLMVHDAVRDAVAVAGSSGLVAFAETDANEDELLAHLRAQLPAVMVPSRVITMEALPRGGTGKVDRAALPDVDSSPARRAFVAPSGEQEVRLASIWSDVLGIEPIGATDDFFELGGDSILSIRIIARAHEAGLTITPRQFFETPTIADLANQAQQ